MKLHMKTTATVIATLVLLVSPAVLSAAEVVGTITDDGLKVPVKPSPGDWNEDKTPVVKISIPKPSTGNEKAGSAECADPELVVMDFDDWKAACQESKGLSRIHEMRIDMMDKSVDSNVTNDLFDQSGLGLRYSVSFSKQRRDKGLAYGVTNFMEFGISIEHSTVNYDNDFIYMLFYSGGGLSGEPFNRSSSENTVTWFVGGSTRGGAPIISSGGIVYRIDWGIQGSNLDSDLDQFASFEKNVLGGRAALQVGWQQRVADLVIVKGRFQYSRTENAYRDSGEVRDLPLYTTAILGPTKLSETYTVGVSVTEFNYSDITVELFYVSGTIYSTGTIDAVREFSGYGAGFTMDL